MDAEVGDLCPNCQHGVIAEIRDEQVQDHGCTCMVSPMPPCSYCTDYVVECNFCGFVP